MLRGGGEEVLMEEMRGGGPPCGDKGGDCAAGNGFKTLAGWLCRVGEVAAEALEEAEPKLSSSFKACDESTPPKASSKEIAADGPSEALRTGRVEGPRGFGDGDSVEKASSNEVCLAADDCGGVPLLAGTP